MDEYTATITDLDPQIEQPLPVNIPSIDNSVDVSMVITFAGGNFKDECATCN